MAGLFNYDFAKVLASVNSVPILNFAEGDGISIDYNEDQAKLKISTDGYGTRSRTNNMSARLTLNLMQSSPVNAVLSTIFLNDLVAPTGLVVPWFIKDVLGATTHNAPTSWCVKWPSSKFAMEAQAVQWVFETNLCVTFIGGNFPAILG